MYSTENSVYGEQERAAYNGNFVCVCYHPLFCFNQSGDYAGVMLRPEHLHSAHGWQEELLPIAARCERASVRHYFRADVAFANPEVYEYLKCMASFTPFGTPAIVSWRRRASIC